jgi:hypothetical protein
MSRVPSEVVHESGIYIGRMPRMRGGSYLSEVGESKAPFLGTVLEPVRLYFRLQRKASPMKNFIPRLI